MSLLTWKDEFSTGVATFDNEHKRLIGLINDLHAAMLQSRSQEVVGDVLRKLVQYTQIHFRHEEEAFARTGYPGAAQHKAQHQRLTQQVMDFVSSSRDNNAHLSMDVLKFLKQWLLDHIEKNDKAYSDYLIKHGVQ
jgi:hemerythrin-like metal-binding domain